jgi:hypothetical protein
MGALMSAPLIALGTAVVVPSAGAASIAGAPHRSAVRTGLSVGNPFCKRLAHKRVLASAAAFGFCFGPQSHTSARGKAAVKIGAGLARNVDAASLAEDVSPAGVRADGQSETSVAASGRYVVEAWNDSTGFLSACPSPMSKEELTGLAFSANGGTSFSDLGGLPNANCKSYIFEGDPSVAAYVAGGRTFFYISSLYDSTTGTGRSFVAMDACEVTGTSGAATLSCGQPTIVGASTQCLKFRISKTKFIKFCSFVDKDYISIDPATGRLYVTYSDFLFRSKNGGDVEELSVCDLGSRSGGSGPAGGTPGAPVCEHGTRLVPAGKNFLASKPYFTVAAPDPHGCELEGSYPAVDIATGAVFVGYEYNWGTNLGFPLCESSATPIQDVLTKSPARCLPLAVVSPCAGPATRAAVPVVSMDGTLVPGFNRFPTNDFPRLAVSDRYGTVSMVWNDARFHPFGDVLLQSFSLKSLRPVQAVPVVLDRPHNGGLDMFPALRSATSDGLLDVSWFSRASVTTSDTSVEAAIAINPRTTATPANIQITNVASNWDNDSSLIVPNFGDYTDNAVSVTGTWPYVGDTLYIAWSDGRLGIPQPFEAHLPAG